MNSCVLMAEVITNPELRKTPDDVDVANMMVVIPGLRDDDPSSQIRVVGWRNVGVEMSQNYQLGDRIILEGRLAMNLVERNGYKQKSAELVVSRIYRVGQAENAGFNQDFAQAAPVQQAPAQQFTQPMAQPTAQPAQQSKSSFTPPYTPSSVPEYSAPATSSPTTEDFDDNALDEIPF